MGLFRNIFNNIFNKKEMLAEAKVEEPFQNTYDIRESFAQRQKKDVPEIKHDTIEYALDQYLKAMTHAYEQKGFFSSYNALISLSSGAHEQGNGNKQKETELIKTLKNYPEKYDVYGQEGKNGNVDFFHIKNGPFMDKNAKSSDLRIYLNLRRENLADFSLAIIKEFKDVPLYFKLVSDDYLKGKTRSEKIVFFTDVEDFNKTVTAIESVKQKRPELLECSGEMNPFLSKISGHNNIGYAPDFNGRYKNREGKIEMLDPSYNTLLARVLEDSFKDAAQEVIANDEGLTVMTNGEIYDNVNEYKKLLPILEKSKNNELIEAMKKGLSRAVFENNLQINMFPPQDDRDNSEGTPK